MAIASPGMVNVSLPNKESIMTKRCLMWFRHDLRLTDNPAWIEACQAEVVIPVYVLDTHPSTRPLGQASRLWLHHALASLEKDLGVPLHCYTGPTETLIPSLCEQYDIDHICWNRAYEPWRITQDTMIKKTLRDQGIKVSTHHASLLWEPWTITKQDNTPFKVFTPFYRKGCLQATSPRQALPKPIPPAHIPSNPEASLAQLKLQPSDHWTNHVLAPWTISEEGALAQLEHFLQHGLNQYKTGRDYPSQHAVSRLSPYLRWGQLSPHQVWHAACNYAEDHQLSHHHIDHFCSELGWREFAYQQLYIHPELHTQNLQSKFNRFPWHRNEAHLRAWQQGKTGIPLVDAGMRQLWQTGYMHNRIRMVTGSFLVKNLLIHWREGEAWFWDCLVDADPASNPASWQWVAGCGADAAPYFRIFNPVTQAERFDPDGEYIAHYVPELAKLPTPFRFKPWEAPTLVLQEAGITLGKDYPFPLVDLKTSRQAALEALASIKTQPT